MLQGWFRMMSAGAEMVHAALRTSEAVAAAGRVIQARSEILADGFKNPIAADYAELGMLVPEKVMATGRAASGVMTESLRIWADASRFWPATTARNLAAVGKPLDLMAQTMGLYATALDPFHIAVTRNDRRLRRKRR